MAGPKMRDVYSSVIDQVGYSPEDREYHVLWSTGKYSVYSDVPPEKAEEIGGSASIGQAVHRLLKAGGHDHEYR